MAAYDQPDLIDGMKRLGFTEHEARVYIALLGRNPATGYEISKACGLPRANVYATLESLTAKEAVQPAFENPVRYVPVPPDKVMQRVRVDVDRTCDFLAEQLQQVGTETDVDYVWNLRGVENIHRKFAELVESAHSRVSIKIYDQNLLPHMDALRRAADRGVQIVVVLFGSIPADLDFATVYLHEENGIPVGIAHRNITVTVDFEAGLMANLDEASGAYTRSRSLVSVADTLIRHDIYLSEIMRKLGPEVEQLFGPALIELRRQLLPKDQAEDLERSLERLPD